MVQPALACKRPAAAHVSVSLTLGQNPNLAEPAAAWQTVSTAALIVPSSVGLVECLQGSTQLTESERHAVHALSKWLRCHSTAPGDQDDLAESDEDGELAEAFTYQSRNSGAVSTT